MDHASEKAGKTGMAKKEEEILKFWRDKNIFEKTLEKTKGGRPFVFYDGPPFATGLPHYGHLLAGTIKDAIPRYQTMRGRFVRRQWGWDCHGLPVENLIEQELGLGHKKDIETFGVGKFNAEAKKSVLRYDSEWKKQVPRMGRFVDMKHSYKTMDWTYTESIWWAWGKLAKEGLVYEGYKPMHICPRCETTLSNFEVAQGYKEITDLSATVMFPIADEKDTYALAWTTTPWTLPGNVALAVSSKIEYGIYKQDGKKYIVAALCAENILGGKPYTLEREISGEELAGKSYLPPFPEFYDDKELKNCERGWKIRVADFVTDTDGTGIVHIAPAFGADDMALGRKEELPFVQHVKINGEIVGVAALEGRQAKPKEDPQKTDIGVIKYLAHKGLLFAKEKISHSYPHCWRCHTPLLNYAASSWFIRVSEIKGKLITENKKIVWTPEHIGSARFANILEDAPDWAVSRARYWGAPIPVWKCDLCEKREIIGSVDELRGRARTSGNKYFVMRHGQADSNVTGTVSGGEHAPNHLTEKGKEEVLRAAKELKDEGIDFIFASPLIRTRETAQIIAQELGVSSENIVYDSRLKEIYTGEFDEKPVKEYRAYFSSREERFTKHPMGGETVTDVKRRIMEALYDFDKRYKCKNILIITHETPVWMVLVGVEGADQNGAIRLWGDSKKDEAVETGSLREVDFVPIPHDRDYELDLHRPYIDEIVFDCACGGISRRIPEVFDCWVESGSMPFAQFHYPFENKELFEKNFPADFIAEGVDQTRGWFYSLLVLGVGLFGESPYKNVIVNGTILTEDGQKMSKSLKNYPDPMDVVEKYGADAVRYYLLSSPVVRGEDLAFSEKGVKEIHKKVLLRLQNVVSFYELYATADAPHPVPHTPHMSHILDQWIVARTNELVNEVTKATDAYELDRATRPFADFIDDLSTWYIRRSRERFKSDNEEDRNSALLTTRRVLLTFSKIAAPFMPFIAEDIYKKIGGEKESVHLEDWPIVQETKNKKQRTSILEEMAEVRRISSLGLEARAKAGIKVRQPLALLKIKQDTRYNIQDTNFLELIKDEVNVKEVRIEGGFDGGAAPVNEAELDTEITENLKKEGQMRELVRGIQDLRKKAGFTPSDMILMTVATTLEGEGLIGFFEEDIKKIVLASGIIFAEKTEGAEIKVDDITFGIALLKNT